MQIKNKMRIEKYRFKQKIFQTHLDVSIRATGVDETCWKDEEGSYLWTTTDFPISSVNIGLVS